MKYVLLCVVAGSRNNFWMFVYIFATFDLESKCPDISSVLIFFFVTDHWLFRRDRTRLAFIFTFICEINYILIAYISKPINCKTMYTIEHEKIMAFTFKWYMVFTFRFFLSFILIKISKNYVACIHMACSYSSRMVYLCVRSYINPLRTF